MADFCKHCSIQLFGKDFGDLAELGPADDGQGNPWYYQVLCEGCGGIMVNHQGARVTPLDEQDDENDQIRGMNWSDPWPVIPTESLSTNPTT